MSPIRKTLLCTLSAYNLVADPENVIRCDEMHDKSERFRAAVLNALRCYDAAIAQDSGPLTRKRAAGSLAADLRIALKESKE